VISLRARWLLAALMLVLVPTIAMTLATGMAAWHARAAQDYLVAASRTNALYDEPAQSAAEASLVKARGWRPNDASLMELDARLALQRAGSDAIADARRAEAIAHAIAVSQSATLRRPRWPYGWLVLARAYAARGDRGEGWANAIVNAARFGPNETRIHAALARDYLQRDARRAPRVAAVLADAYARALAREPQNWIDAADRAGIGADVCARPALPPSANARCMQLGWLTPDDASR
jgi:hypothetical protein